MAGIIVGVAHFVSSQNSVWLKMILYLFGGVNASSIDTTLIAEYAYRALSLSLAPLLCLCWAHVAAEHAWFNPLHTPLSTVILRNPLFMLLGKIAVPFLLSHTLLTCLVLNSNGLTGRLYALQGTTSSILTLFAAQDIIEFTEYSSKWLGSTGKLCQLYFVVLSFSTLGAVVLSMAVLQPVLRYFRDRLMCKFSVAKQWRDLL